MGLRSFSQNEKSYYMYSSSEKDTLYVVLLQADKAYRLKLEANNEAVVNWSRNLEKTPQEYLTVISSAISHQAADSNGKDMKEDVFEVQDEHLIWKQYFPDKKLHGRRGKFGLEKLCREKAVEEILNGVMQELAAGAQAVSKMTQDLEGKSQELIEAKSLAAKSVKMKEDFEKEIYGKCATLINSKKLKIRQLHSKLSTDKGKTSNTSGNQKESHSVEVKVDSSDHECYDSDTDVDDPVNNSDVDHPDTDDEVQIVSPKKDQKNQKDSRTPKKTQVPKRIIDSQDDLFNMSIDAELYTTASTEKKRKVETKKTIGPSRTTAKMSSQLDSICDSSAKQISQKKINQEPVNFSSSSLLDEWF